MGHTGTVVADLTFTVQWRGEFLDEGQALALASLDGTAIAGLRWDSYAEPPVVLDITVDEPYQRMGVATALFDWVKTHHQSQLAHSDTLTSDGVAWVASLG